MRNLAAVVLAGGAVAGLGMTLGCRVDTHKNGDNKDVKIATPFGGVSVKTNEDVVEGGVGLTVYPGATLVKKESGHDNGAADINMSFGGFHLGVKALSYRTGDAPDRVRDFYRKDMARYGVVLLCHDKSTVGTPSHTQDGLSCNDDSNSHVHVSDDDTKGDELKAGSRQHQHIVAIDADGSGTKIGLVALDLPGRLVSGDSDEKQ